MFRKLLALTAMLAALGFVFAACEVEDDADADSTTTPPTDTTTPPTDTGVALLDYTFVRVDDLSETVTTPDGGADIDSIIVYKADGSANFADSVEAFLHGGGVATGDELDPTEALGAPDAFYDYDVSDASPDSSVCDVDSGTFVSLGGTGGYLITHMGDTIENGDNVTVLEVGGCSYGSGDAIIEEVQVSVSVGSEPNGQWVLLGSGDGPEVSFSVSGLPDVPAN